MILILVVNTMLVLKLDYINPMVLVLLNTYVIWYLLVKASKSMDTKTGIFVALVICYCISKSHYMRPAL